MARGGINKYLVQQARDVIRARGDYPSIDTVRIELGNTGSKSTIHRYLKELEEEEGSRLDDRALLSDTLQDMVGRLAERLQEEARTLVERADTAHQAKAKEWLAQDESRSHALNEASSRIEALEQQLNEAQQKHHELGEKHQALALENERQTQHITDLDGLLAEKEAHLKSLEEKHRHARDAMEHYRQSVKEQRDQDLRRHEQQVQQIQAETRQLQQTLSVKHSEITQLNADNSRLLAELGGAQKQIRQDETRLQQRESQHLTAEQRATTLAVQLDAATLTQQQQFEQLQQWETRYKASTEERQHAEITLGALRAELSIKDRIIETMERERIRTQQLLERATAEHQAADSE